MSRYDIPFSVIPQKSKPVPPETRISARNLFSTTSNRVFSPIHTLSKRKIFAQDFHPPGKCRCHVMPTPPRRQMSRNVSDIAPPEVDGKCHDLMSRHPRIGQAVGALRPTLKDARPGFRDALRDLERRESWRTIDSSPGR